ncbi:MAG: carboxypeptidase-like regulatory domain-containing protein [Gemmatimonadaceae bacterium]
MRHRVMQSYAAVLGVASLSLALMAGSVNAQQATGINGVVIDSIHGKPLAEATVFVTRIEPASPEFARTISSDKQGTYRLDGLSAGRYAIWFNHPILDSLEVTVLLREVTLAAGEHARIDLGLPSGATLRRIACPGVELPQGTGAVNGTVINAENERPLNSATVVVSWADIAIDRATLRLTTSQRSVAVRVDSSGAYGLCGVPTENELALQLQVDGRVGSVIRTEVSGDVGVRRLNLSLGAKASYALSGAAVAADTSAELLSGTAALKGTVRTGTGAPLRDVMLYVNDAAGSVRTDSLGNFVFNDLPEGSHQLEARRIGYLIARRPLELRSGRTMDVQLTLDRIVRLDAFSVLARSNRYADFEQNRRHGIGQYLTERQIADRHALETIDLFRTLMGFRVNSGSLVEPTIQNTRGGGKGDNGDCAPNIVINNMPNQDLNLLKPSDIGAIEAYRNVTGGPPGTNKGCGVIVIWTKQ